MSASDYNNNNNNKNLIDTKNARAEPLDNADPSGVGNRRPVPEVGRPSTMMPNNWTVILCDNTIAQEEKAMFDHHVGNRRFHLLCEINAQKYASATSSPTDKFAIIMDIIHTIRKASGCGGFVRKVPFQPNEFCTLNDEDACQCVHQELRRIIASRSCCSTPSSSGAAAANNHKRTMATVQGDRRGSSVDRPLHLRRIKPKKPSSSSNSSSSNPR
ncbi:hypothetical protein ACA910_014912 [Epithemia clementina (nom. ined.)]